MYKPTYVEYAGRIIWVTVALSLAIYIIERQRELISSAYFFLGLLMLALYSILPYKISQGRNWARVLYVTLSVLGYSALLAGETEYLTSLQVVAGLAALPLDVTAGILLFRPESNEWFRANSQ